MSRLQNNQEGLVSITVSLIIMIIITLVVSSFALIVRREQRRTLDRQLSTQAFYAAEAGIADAQSAIKAGLSKDVTECSGTNSFATEVSGIITPSKSTLQYNSTISDNVSYSCVLIDQTPTNYDKHGIKPEDGSFVATIKSADSSLPINKIRISWQKGGGAQITNSNSDYALKNDIDGPLLRVTVFPGFPEPVNGIPQSLTKDAIENGSHTMFLYPMANTSSGLQGSIGYLGGRGGWNSTDSEQGQFVNGNCNIDNRDVANNFYECNADITGLSAKEYFVVIQPLYKSADLSLTAYNGTNKVNLSGGQAEIDVTGKASDVLRRIKVRVPIDGGASIGDFDGLFPDAAISTTEDLCKQLILAGTQLEDKCDPLNDGQLSSVTIPPPTNPPPNPNPNPNGNADIGLCDGSANQPRFCGNSNDPQLLWGWSQGYANWAQNPASEVDRCVWSWGDGHTTVLSGGAKGCNYDDQMVHDYSSSGHPNLQNTIINSNGNQGCRRYSVKLTVYFKSSTGKPPVSKTETRGQVPYGSEGKKYCTGKYRLYTP